MHKDLLIKVLLGANILGLGILLFTSILDNSPTTDEPPHILSGYVALKYGQNYIDPEHPLLIKAYAAAPLIFQDLKFNQADPNYANQKDDFNIGKMFKASREFLGYQGNNVEQIMLSTRIPMILLTLFFALIIFLFTQKLFGSWAALLATFFYSTEPVILANGPLVNTDIPAAGFVITTIFALYLYGERQTSKRLFFLILALTAALLSKFSTFYLVPIVLILMEFIYRQAKNYPRIHIVYLLAGSAALISLFYGIISFRTEGLAGFLPLQYIEGLVIIFSQVSSAERFSYLLGESYIGSRIYYFPILVALKTQLLTLFGFLIGIFYLLKKFIAWDKKTLAIFFVPLTGFFALALAAKFNIGIRHVLPIYPFLIILAAGAFFTAFKVIHKTQTLFVLGLLVIMLFSLRFWSTATTYPHFLSYYNILAGGTDNGWKVAGDSNYDWGQDVKRLVDYLKENKIEKIAFDNYSGTWTAALYDFDFTPITPANKTYKGYFAVSTSVLNFHEDKPENYSWVVDNYEPIARIGKSIFIFDIK